MPFQESLGCGNTTLHQRHKVRFVNIWTGEIQKDVREGGASSESSFLCISSNLHIQGAEHKHYSTR